MINIEIDFSKATDEEIKAFYAIPGLQSALSELQTHNRKYNAHYSVIAPNAQLVEVKVLIMEFMRKHKLVAGNTIPEKPFTFSFVQSLNPAQQALVVPSLVALISEGVLEAKNNSHILTDIGYGVLY